MLHKEIPFLRLVLPLCAGIVSGLYFTPTLNIIILSVLLAVAGFFSSLFFNKYQTNLVYGFAITYSLFISGLVLYTNEKIRITSLPSETSVFQCTLSDYPAEKENTYMLTVKLSRIIKMEGSVAAEGSMLLYYRKDSLAAALLPGDQLTLSCRPIEIINRGNPYEFDYRFYMENSGIKYYAFADKKNILAHISPPHRKLAHIALIIRQKIIDIYKESGINGERLALVAAMTLGQRNMLDPEQKQNFIKAGVMHIMAVSGLHSVILSMFIFSLLFFMKNRLNIVRVAITVILLWAFAFVTGLTPSVMRATLMFTFIQAGTLMKRNANSINSVLASAFVLIIIRPSVIFDAGFLLSYAAVIYIICFYQDFYLKIHFKNRISDKIWQSAVVTVVAQLGTLPLTIMLFNRFPTYFILTNIIIVPISSLLIIVGAIVPIVYPVHFISHISAWLLSYLTGVTEYLTATASSLPLSNIENIGITTIECIFLTITIFFFTVLILKKQKISVLIPTILMFLFVIACSVREISTRTSNQLIVYNTPGSSVIGIKTGKILNIYSDTVPSLPEVLKHSATLGLVLKQNKLTRDFLCLKTGGKTILLTNSLQNNILSKFNPDIVVLTGKMPDIENLLLADHFRGELIVTPESGAGFRIPQYVYSNGLDSIHLVKKSGAFIRTL